jgi:hypothetical protein
MTPAECPACGGALDSRGSLVECGNQRCGLAGRAYEPSRLTNKTQRRRLQRDAGRAKHRRSMQALSDQLRYSVVTSRSTVHAP